MNTPSSSPALELAARYDADIRASVAAQYGLPVEELEQLTDQASASEAEPGSFIFMVVHATGVFGVHATQNADGTMKFTATSL